MSTESTIVKDGRLLRARLSDLVVEIGGVSFRLKALDTSAEAFCEDMSTGTASYGRLLVKFGCCGVDGLCDADGQPVRIFDRYLPNGVQQEKSQPGDHWWEAYEIGGFKYQAMPDEILRLLHYPVVRELARAMARLNRLSGEEKKDLPSGGDSASEGSSAGGTQRAADSPADQGGEPAAPAG